MKDITITISAKSGVGKSTLAANLSKILTEQGFSVKLNDIDVNNSSVNFLAEDRLKHIINNSAITIDTYQVSR